MAATGTPWFRLYSQLRSHPKLEDLAASLALSKAQAVGHLVLLWCWVTDYAEDGDLCGVNTSRIERAAAWEGRPGAFVRALAACRWLDGQAGAYSVHNWLRYAESYNRAQNKKNRRGLSRDSRGTVAGEEDDSPPEQSRAEQIGEDSSATVTEPRFLGAAVAFPVEPILGRPVDSVEELSQLAAMELDGSREGWHLPAPREVVLEAIRIVRARRPPPDKPAAFLRRVLGAKKAGWVDPASEQAAARDHRHDKRPARAAQNQAHRPASEAAPQGAPDVEGGLRGVRQVLAELDLPVPSEASLFQPAGSSNREGAFEATVDGTLVPIAGSHS